MIKKLKGGVTEETPSLRSNSSSYCLSKTVNLYNFQSTRKPNSEVADMKSTMLQMLVLHHRRNEKHMERPRAGEEIPGAHRKKSFKGHARNKNDLGINEPLAPFPKKTAQVSLHQTISETELKFRVCQMQQSL